MSTYLSYRRRYSAPEKPEPRFQWRLRVHSLMMDETDKTPSLLERRSQRYDSRQDSGEAYGYSTEIRHEKGLSESNDADDSPETHRRRRDRFTRTKSEGHLKLRVRFSKYSDTSKSFDDDDEQRMYSESERRKLRSSQESGIESFGEHHTDEEEERSGKREARSCSKFQDNADADDGFAGEESPGSSADDGAVGGSSKKYEDDEEENDTNKGAIPKRYSNNRTDRSSLSCEEGQETSFTRKGRRSISGERQTPEGHEGSSDINEDKEPMGCMIPTVRKSRKPSTEHSNEALELLEEYDKLNLNDRCGEHQSHETEKRPTDNNADDIESIIERIIAEEEALLVAKNSCRESLKKTSVETSLDEDSYKTERQNIRDDAENCQENKLGVNINRSNDQDKQHSSSLPSYQREEDQSLTKTVMPFSSSCPSSKNNLTQDRKTDDDEEEEEDGWAYLPVILLEDVFTLLTPKERHQASQVCRQWYDLFYSPRVWETFILLERTLTKKRFNLYKGYQRELCPGKTQLCFRRVGSFFKRIVVTPITDYFNLYEFLRILAAFLQYQEDHGLAAMPLLHTFDFTFACASRGDGEIIVHGTGGQILEMIKQLLIRISNLKHLKLNQLLIDETDVPGLFDAMANCFSECLSSLEMLNVTKVPLGLTDLARFRNLVKLTVSPQHLNEEVLLLLAGLNLLQLHLLQDPYTCECEPVSYEAWKLVREMAPWLRVYLEVAGNTRAQLLIQPRAPVYGVFLRTPYSRLTNDLVMFLVEHYSKTLRYFVQERLPRIHGPRGIDARCDSSLLFLTRRCPALHTLVIRERISTSTLILLANEGKSLKTLLVRRHALIKRCDWPQPGAWTKEFYARLKQCSLDYDKCTDEVCRLLRRRWRPLTDKQFMRLKIIPRAEVL